MQLEDDRKTCTTAKNVEEDSLGPICDRKRNKARPLLLRNRQRTRYDYWRSFFCCVYNVFGVGVQAGAGVGVGVVCKVYSKEEAWAARVG